MILDLPRFLSARGRYMFGIAAGYENKHQSFRRTRFVKNTWLGKNMEIVKSLLWRLGEGAFCVPNSKSFAIKTGPTDRRVILRILQSSITGIAGNRAEQYVHTRSGTLTIAIVGSC